jgi:hypothetical protein
MRLRRKIVTAVVSVVCGLALAACGQQVVAHVSAADTVHSGLGGVFSSPTTRFDVTAQNLPGTASLADGSFSVVLTVSPKAAGQPYEVSIYHLSSDLADLLQVNGSAYFRVNVKQIAAFAGANEYSTIASEFNKVSARPGYGFVHDLLLGNWVGISRQTSLALSQKFLSEDMAIQKQLFKVLPAGSKAPASLSELQGLEALSHNPAKLKQLKLDVSSSLLQSVQMWLSIHQKSANEYSLNLPVRAFLGSLVDKLVKPVESLVKGVAVSKTQIATTLERVPSGLTVNANVWIQNGSVTKIQAFIPMTSAYLDIAVSHPSAPVTAPSGATMLTAPGLEALLPKIPNLPTISGISAITTTTQSATGSSSA